MEGKDLNRLKVVLAERPSHGVQMVYQQRTTQLGELDGGSQMSRSKRQ